MKRNLIATASVAALVSVAASGAAHAQVDPGDWTGPYVGGHIGYGMLGTSEREGFKFDTDLDGEFDDNVRTGAGADAFSPGFCGGAAQGNAPAAGCVEDEDKSYDVGVHAGYDYQISSLVVGAVAELSYANVSDSVTAFSTTPASYTFHRRLNGTAALRARAGLSFGNILPYATAGMAYGDIDNAFTTTNGANSFTATEDDSSFGWQYGAGVEAKINDRWSVAAEYLMTEFDSEDYIVRAGNSGTTPATNPFLLVNTAGTDLQRTEDFEYSTLRVKASMRF